MFPRSLDRLAHPTQKGTGAAKEKGKEKEPGKTISNQEKNLEHHHQFAREKVVTS